jgi:S-adenosylmethionine:tRNA ribosyltransferase-isomerase
VSPHVEEAAPLRLADLDFDLPPELVAQRPLPQRDACRLLHVRRAAPGAALVERRFEALPSLLQPGDVLVRNVTRVIPARLQAVKETTGAHCEILLLEPEAHGGWWSLVRPARRLPPGSHARLVDGTPLEVVAAADGGRRLLLFPADVNVLERARALGTMPLPPYIRRPADAEDVVRYQTVYARVDGSVAAPTAGLHFTPELLRRLEARGVQCVDLVLHVGLGTFQPIRCEDPLRHPMHWERFEIGLESLARLDAARSAGGRVVAVGTTVARALESVALWERSLARDVIELEEREGALQGRTRLFIHPPHAFRRFDALLTNFHLPCSTLLLLVDAFAGREARRRAYAHAVQKRFRFFSYGDAMLVE